MAAQFIQPDSAPVSTIVQAYLAARAEEQRQDQSDGPNDTFEARMAQFAEGGARDCTMKWSIDSAEHGALVALLAAERLQYLVEGYSIRNARGQRVVTFGAEELNEINQVKHALLNIWSHLDPYPTQRLQALAIDLNLIDERGRELDF